MRLNEGVTLMKHTYTQKRFQKKLGSASDWWKPWQLVSCLRMVRNQISPASPCPYNGTRIFHTIGNPESSRVRWPGGGRA